MKYTIELSEKVNRDLLFFKKAGDKVILKKIKKLLFELESHPTTGTGKPEQLKHQFSGLWSRRINKEHRMIYEIVDEKCVVFLISAKGHY